MKTRETTPGKTYSVHTMNGCTIIEPDGWQKTIEAPDGYFDAHFGSVVIEGDDEASIKQLFKLAPQQRLALLGVLGGNGGLPAGYTRLAYLEGTGTQYIETPVLLNSAYSVLFDVMFTQSSLSTALWGFRDNNIVVNGGVYALVANASECVIWRYNKRSSVAWAVGQRYEFLQTNRQLLRNGSLVASYSAPEWQTSLPCRVFKAATASSFKGRFYNFAVMSGTRNVIKLVPALKPDGEACMFDTVSRKPFRNSGSGQFVAGVETQSQLNKLLRRLPDRTGQEVGTLTMRLADNLQTEENRAAMDAMVSKNWEITEAA